MIREGKSQQIYSVIEMGREYGMHTMEQSTNDLITKGILRREDAATISGFAA